MNKILQSEITYLNRYRNIEKNESYILQTIFHEKINLNLFIAHRRYRDDEFEIIEDQKRWF